jgi:hypothetical protein
MEENKFEKQVQQKMDELKIPPSESVWQKIEMRIEKRKPRRRILFFILPLFFLLGGYWIYNAYHSTSKGYLRDKNILRSDSKESEVKNVNESTSKNVNPVNTALVKQKVNNDVTVMTTSNSNSSKSHSSKFINNNKLTSKIISPENGDVNILEEKNEKKLNVEKDNGEPESEKLGQIVQSQNVTDTKKDSNQNIDSNVPLKKSLEKNAKETDTSKTVAAAKNKSSKDKWQVGLLFSGGVSAVGNNFLALQNSLPADYINASPSGPGQINQFVPSKTKNSFAFIVGGFAEKNILKKAKLSLGINFKLFNTTNSIGTKNDSTRALAAGNKSNYRNHFSFIEFPVEFKFQIISSKQFPLFWNAGITISQMLGSNALQFNQNTGYYFTDNSLFNKTNIGLNTGFTTNIFSRQKGTLSIGPYFFYDLSKLANKGLYENKHFVFAGLRSEFLFGRK